MARGEPVQRGGRVAGEQSQEAAVGWTDGWCSHPRRRRRAHSSRSTHMSVGNSSHEPPSTLATEGAPCFQPDLLVQRRPPGRIWMRRDGSQVAAGHVSPFSRTRLSHLSSGGSETCWFSLPGF